ncbi:hypothetical protein NL676_008902 [Syzygium grande]|nr:hypothetical protein NL676_008902 [Syzygium grande]
MVVVVVMGLGKSRQWESAVALLSVHRHIFKSGAEIGATTLFIASFRTTYIASSPGGLDNKGPIYGFYNTTEGEDPDKVYGLFLCRADVDTNLCQSCINSATSLIIERCPGQKEATIWYDECFVRYANRSFFSIMETLPIIFIVNPADVELTVDNEDFETEVTDFARNVTDLAISSESLYATKNINVSSSVTLHELAQCTPDISKSDCKSCLLSAIKEFPTVLNHKRGRCENSSAKL